MQCLSCQADIPPQWVAAINSNTCPGCGGNIMDDSAKELLGELREAMSKMPNDPAGLAGWLLSNYSLQKIGTAEPTSFHRKMEKRAAQPTAPGLKIADNPVQKFLKRTDAAKELEKRSNLQQIVAEIQGVSESQYGDDIEEEIEGLDEEDQAVYEAEMNRRNFRSEAKAKAQASWMVSDPEASNVKPLSAKDIQNISNTFGEEEEPELPPALQQARLLRLAKQQEIARGNKPGVFGRGS